MRKPAYVSRVKFRAPCRICFYDPQTSGGLLFALPEQDAQGCLDELQQSVPEAKIVGYVTEKQEFSIYLE